jgi:hypothetical protein
MKYLKKFNENIADHKFCGECGLKLDMNVAYCPECGTPAVNPDSGQKTFTIDGKIETSYPSGQKTPNFTISSMNKTISGTTVVFDKSINKYDVPVGKEVSITGTTKDGLVPKFNNPIIVSDIKDVVVK